MIEKTSIVIPKRHKEEYLGSTVKHLKRERRLRGVPHEIVVVDDGSVDGTSEILADVAREIPVPSAARIAGMDG